MAFFKNLKTKLAFKLTKKFRLVVLNEETLEERFSFRLTRMNVFVFGGIFSIILISLTVLLIAFTPIKQYIPGFSSTKLKIQASELVYKVDSLETHMNSLIQFTEGMRSVLSGEKDEMDIALVLSKKGINNDSLFNLSENIKGSVDSAWNVRFEKEKQQLKKKYQEQKLAFTSKTKDSVLNLTKKYETNLAYQKKKETYLREKLSDSEKKLLTFEKEIVSLLSNKEDTSKSVPAKVIAKAEPVKVVPKKEIVKEKTKTVDVAKIKSELEKTLHEKYVVKEKRLTNSYHQKVEFLTKNNRYKSFVIDSLTYLVSKYKSNESKQKTTASKNEALVKRSKKDSLFREKVEREDRFNLYDFEKKNTDIVFVSPVKGIITQKYNVKEKHFAVDVAVKKGSPVKSIADGIVIFAEWTAETGYVIIVKHKNQYLSVYKHNELLYRNQGDLVKTGEVISKAGSTGEYSTGTHLHFEMWVDGYPVNPIKFIEFE